MDLQKIFVLSGLVFLGPYVNAGDQLDLSVHLSWPDSHKPALHQRKPADEPKNIHRIEVSQNPFTGNQEFVNRTYSVDGNVINEFYTGYVVRE